jgi:hypothetical protein
MVNNKNKNKTKKQKQSDRAKFARMVANSQGTRARELIMEQRLAASVKKLQAQVNANPYAVVPPKPTRQRDRAVRLPELTSFIDYNPQVEANNPDKQLNALGEIISTVLPITGAVIKAAAPFAKNLAEYALEKFVLTYLPVDKPETEAGHHFGYIPDPSEKAPATSSELGNFSHRIFAKNNQQASLAYPCNPNKWYKTTSSSKAAYYKYLGNDEMPAEVRQEQPFKIFFAHDGDPSLAPKGKFQVDYAIKFRKMQANDERPEQDQVMSVIGEMQSDPVDGAVTLSKVTKDPSIDLVTSKVDVNGVSGGQTKIDFNSPREHCSLYVYCNSGDSYKVVVKKSNGAVVPSENTSLGDMTLKKYDVSEPDKNTEVLLQLEGGATVFFYCESRNSPDALGAFAENESLTRTSTTPGTNTLEHFAPASVVWPAVGAAPIFPVPQNANGQSVLKALTGAELGKYEVLVPCTILATIWLSGNRVANLPRLVKEAAAGGTYDITNTAEANTDTNSHGTSSLLPGDKIFHDCNSTFTTTTEVRWMFCQT